MSITTGPPGSSLYSPEQAQSHFKKIKNYNPIDFVKEREEENREFFKLRPKEEKVAEKEEIMQEPTKSRMRR